jgi:hypothetical protein
VIVLGRPLPGRPTKETFGSQPASRPPVTKQIPLEQGARVAVGRFILTAVARQNLDEAWNLATPSIKGGLTHKQWMTGNIPVVPLGVPIDKAAITRIISSTKNEAQINVVVLPKPNKVGVRYAVRGHREESRSALAVDYAVPGLTRRPCSVVAVSSAGPTAYLCWCG